MPKEIPQADQPTESPVETLYHLQQALSAGDKEPEEVNRLLAEYNKRIEKRGDSIRELIRYGFDSKSVEAMTLAIRYLEDALQGNLRTTPAPESDIKELVETGNATIPMGSGSLGGRVMIRTDALWMTPDREEYDGDVRKRFQELFGLSGEELHVQL